MKSSIFMSTTFRHRTINQPRDQCKFVVPLASIAPPASRASDKTSSQECHQKQFITAIAMPSKIIALPNLLCAQRPLNPPKIESGPMRLTVSLPLCFPPWLVQVGANFEIRESPVNSSYDYIEKSPVSKFASTWASHSGKQDGTIGKGIRCLVTKFAPAWTSQGGKQCNLFLHHNNDGVRYRTFLPTRISASTTYG